MGQHGPFRKHLNAPEEIHWPIPRNRGILLVLVPQRAELGDHVLAALPGMSQGV